MIGPTAYQRLQNQLSPKKLGEMAYKDLVTLTRASEITQSLESAAHSIQTLQGTSPLTDILRTVIQPKVL